MILTTPTQQSAQFIISTEREGGREEGEQWLVSKGCSYRLIDVSKEAVLLDPGLLGFELGCGEAGLKLHAQFKEHSHHFRLISSEQESEGEERARAKEEEEVGDRGFEDGNG